MNLLRPRRRLAVIAALLLVLFIFRPGVGTLRNRISGAIGNALGRRVVIDNVRLHPLPRPGFDLEGLTIYDDPAFSAEPMIRAQDVFAAIRLRSLLRGRLEIAALSATGPSINIVRASDGRWNLAALLERNAQIPAAPTQKAASERRPAFPYLEATNARINFKFGPVKTSYALVDADVALWQDSENSWGARMKAEPVRTDFNLTDTGQVQVNAAWHRAASLHLTPLRMTVSWRKGQLGQITTLLTGKDRGWRGDVDFTASLQGTPEALAIENETAIQGFRRYDIFDERNIRLTTRCAAKYSATSRQLTDLLCQSPVKDGTLRLSGDLGVMTSPVSYDLSLEATQVPLASIAELAHETKKQLPDDLTADGSLDAEFHALRSGNGPAEFTGAGTASAVLLKSDSGRNSLALGDVPLALLGGPTHKKTDRAHKSAHDDPAHDLAKALVKEADAEPAEPHLRIGPASLAVNAAAPLSTGGWISVSGYRFFLRGDLALKNLFRIENALGVPTVQPAVEGSARMDISISGPWRGLPGPNALGTAQLKNVRAEVRGLNTPIEIASATVVLASDDASLQQISVRMGETHWTGSVRAPRRCAPTCLYQFDLSADLLSTAEIAQWFTQRHEPRPWYRTLGSNEQTGPSPLLALRAHGNLHVGRFEIKKALATELTTELTADRGKITLDHLKAGFLQGTHQGHWSIDSSTNPPRYRGTGTLENVSLDRFSTLMNDGWITGTADGSFDVDASGTGFREMLTNSTGRLQFVMRNGSFTRIALPGMSGSLPVHRFSGDLRLKDGAWQLSAGRLESRYGLYQIKGTSSPISGLNFLFTRGDEKSWTLKGSLAKPQVVPPEQEVSRTETEADTKVEFKP